MQNFPLTALMMLSDVCHDAHILLSSIINVVFRLNWKGHLWISLVISNGFFFLEKWLLMISKTGLWLRLLKETSTF